MNAGRLIIKTVMDNSNLKKGLKENKKIIEKYKNEENIEETKSLIEQKKEAIESLEYYNRRKKEIKNEAKELLKTAQSQEEINKILRDRKISLNALKGANTEELSNLKNIITEIDSKGIKDVTEKTKVFSNLIGKAASFGKGLGSAFLKILGTIGKVALKIAGIGLLLGGLSIGIGILGAGFKKAFENEQIKANIDYIKFAITKAIEPALNRIVDFVTKLINLLFRVMKYIQYIIYAWTGKNIFENASVDDYADSLKKAEKNAKDLKNQLTKFDEMEVLQDNSSEKNTTTTMPNLDLSNIEDMEVPTWIKWIADNKDIVIAALAGITGGLIAMKLFGLDPIETSGVILFISGLVYAIKKLLEYLDNPSWKNFGGVIEGIGLAVIGLGILFLGLPGIVAGIIILIIGILIKYWDEIKKWIKENVFDWFDKKINEFGEKGFWGNLFANILKEIKAFIYDITISFDTLFKGLKYILDGFIKIFKGDFAGGIKLIFRGTINSIIGIINGFTSIINGLFAPLRGLINEGAQLVGIKTNIGDYMKLPMLPKLRKGTILNNPGKGVPVAGGSAIAGEAGREAYLPLSDEQLLEELGSSIGRHVVINLTNINKLNGRVLNRETKRINSEDEFAYNG